MQIREYLDDQGRSPFNRWFRRLDATAAARIVSVLARIEAGNLSDVKSLGGGILEKRIHAGPGYRIYFGQDGADLVILLGGGTKRRQRHDIQQAKWRWMDYRQRKRGQS